MILQHSRQQRQQIDDIITQLFVLFSHSFFFSSYLCGSGFDNWLTLIIQDNHGKEVGSSTGHPHKQNKTFVSALHSCGVTKQTKKIVIIILLAAVVLYSHDLLVSIYQTICQNFLKFHAPFLAFFLNRIINKAASKRMFQLHKTSFVL